MSGICSAHQHHEEGCPQCEFSLHLQLEPGDTVVGLHQRQRLFTARLEQIEMHCEYLIDASVSKPEEYLAKLQQAASDLRAVLRLIDSRLKERLTPPARAAALAVEPESVSSATDSASVAA
jgi:hypothetical protein